MKIRLKGETVTSDELPEIPYRTMKGEGGEEKGKEREEKSCLAVL